MQVQIEMIFVMMVMMFVDGSKRNMARRSRSFRQTGSTGWFVMVAMVMTVTMVVVVFVVVTMMIIGG